MSNNTIKPDVTCKDITPGGTIYTAGNSKEVKTGDWRSTKPKFIEEKCKQCGLCFPVCPEDSIPVSKDGKRGDFDFYSCKGCMVCKVVCPFDAIEEDK